METTGFALYMRLDLPNALGGEWYLGLLWLARPNLPRQSAIANQDFDHVPVPDSKCWFRPCAPLLPTIYRAMGLDAAFHRYPPDIQHSRHTVSFKLERPPRFPASVHMQSSLAVVMLHPGQSKSMTLFLVDLAIHVVVLVTAVEAFTGSNAEV